MARSPGAAAAKVTLDKSIEANKAIEVGRIVIANSLPFCLAALTRGPSLRVNLSMAKFSDRLQMARGVMITIALAIGLILVIAEKMKH
jgi:hypothetical protein